MPNSFAALRFAPACVALLQGALVFAGCSSGADSSNPVGGGGASSGSGNDSGGTSSSGSAGMPGSGGSSVVPSSDPHGRVLVSLLQGSDGDPPYSTLSARFFDGPTPETIQLEVDTEMGECQLLVPVVPFCPESCAPGVCTADDECTPYPKPVSVGDLSITGLGEELSLKPTTSMQLYMAPSLPNPPCDAGGKVSASAPELALETDCIGQLELTGPDPVPVMTGQAVSVSWSTEGAAPSSRVIIRLDIAHHGGKKGEITCDVPDSGAFDIPEPLVTELIGLGLAGFPDISVTRVARGSDAESQGAELWLASNVLRAVDTGVVSCQDTSQCPDGQECGDAKVCE